MHTGALTGPYMVMNSVMYVMYCIEKKYLSFAPCQALALACAVVEI